MTRPLMVLIASACLAAPAWAQQLPAATATPPDPPAIDKSGFTFLNPPPETALRGFNSDRPTKSTSPITVDAGHVQIESDLFSYTHSNVGGTTTRLYTFADPLLKLGVTDRVDVEVQFNGYNILDTVRPGRLSNRGAGDIVLKSKVNVFGNEGGPALAVVPYVKFPTAARGIGNGHTEGGVIVPFTYPLPYDFTLEIEPEVDILKNASNAGHHFNFTQLINVGHPIGKLVNVYAELFSTLGTDHLSPPIYTFDAGVTYLVTDTLQLDAGVNVGLNRAAPNLQLYTGIAKRF